MDDAPAEEGAVKGSLVKSSKPESDLPPESPSTQWTRRWIIIAFWAVVICFGLPHWLWTTSTYRADLPLQEMSAWSEGKTCQLHYPLHIILSVPGWSEEAEALMSSATQERLNARHSSHEFRVTVGTHHASRPTSAALAVVLNEHDGSTEQRRTSSLESWEPILNLLYDSGQPNDEADTMASWAAEQIWNVFAAEEESLVHQLIGTSFGKDGQMSLRKDQNLKLDARSTRAFRYASTYHLTFSLFTSASSPSAWEIELALEQYLKPLINALSSISEFTVDTQVQLHAAFSPAIAGPQYDAPSGKWKLQKSDLSGFINAAEWPLSPSIGGGPTINFVLYVPAEGQSPLVIEETGGTSWLIPQWGGVTILNPKGKQPQKLTKQDLESVMLTFADQLSSLIGLPPAPASLALRLSSLARERTTSLIISASSTLGALARLTLKLQSIAIPDSVATSVSSTISHLDQACQDLQAGRYDSALEHARVANDEAERAFFEPSMVGQVYFPDEHKVAVYVPLLGPMAVPLVMAAVKEIRGWRAASKMKSA